MYVGLKQPRGDGERCMTPTRAAAKETTQIQAHGKASPCGHPADTGDRWGHWLEINLASITFSHMSGVLKKSENDNLKMQG